MPPTDPDTDTTGARIRLAREAAGLVQADLATAIGARGGSVSRWECDSCAPGPDSLVALSRVLGVSIDWILTGQGAGPAPAQVA